MKKILLSSLLLFTVACTPVKSPDVPGQPQPTEFRVAATVVDESRKPLEGLICTLVPDISSAVGRWGKISTTQLPRPALPAHR